MFFFFPFAAEPVAAPAPQRAPQNRPLPMLPAPKDARSKVHAGEHSLASAVSEAGNFAVDVLRRAISSFTSSLTALGNRANALFAQVAAALAFERAARDTASFFGMAWPWQSGPRTGFAGNVWLTPYREPAPYSPFSLAAVPANPWALFTEAFDMWTSFWMPATPQRRSLYSAPAPVTTTIALPGCTFSFTLG